MVANSGIVSFKVTTAALLMYSCALLICNDV